MPSKKHAKKRVQNKRIMKRSLAVILASTIGLSSGAMLTTLNNGVSASAAGSLKRYFDDSSWVKQTRIMMDGNNFLLPDYWMQASLTGLGTTPETCSVSLKFSIPGYDINNLKFFVMPKDPSTGGGVTEYKLSSGVTNPIPSVYIPKLNQGAYKVHVYNGSLAEQNFVCKAEWVVTDGNFNSPTALTLVDSVGAPTGQTTNIYKSSTAGVNMWSLLLPSALIPYNASTVKVVFFATNRNGQSVNIDQTLYDYVNYDSTNSGLAYYIQGTPDANVTYEAHFYKNEVAAGNFICKATGITLS